MPTKVFLQKASYESAGLRDEVSALLEAVERENAALGRPTIGPGSRVLLKPNLLAASSPEEAIVTHPLVVRAAAEYALARGALVLVGDSPPMGGFEKIVRACGLREALDGLPLELRELRGPRRVDLPEAGGGRWRSIELSGDALDADVILNLPKLKTHCQMGLTLGVKNLFGCVVGLQKPQWHFRIGENREIFSELLATIARRLSPAITILDGILAMEGDGPGSSGTPRALGLLLASPSALALDMAVSEMVGLGPRGLLTTESLVRMGWDEEPEVVNPLPPVKDFRIPGVREMMLGPKAAHAFLRQHAVARPAPVAGRCRECGLCARVCPAKAITLADGRITIDHTVCIRCYCCLEVCPHRALRRDEPVLGRIIRVIGNRR